MSFFILSIYAYASTESCKELIHFGKLYRENPARVLANKIKLNNLKINNDRITYVVDELARMNAPISAPTWDFPPYLIGSTDLEDVFAFFLVVNSINYKYFVTGSTEEFRDGDLREALLMATRVADHWEELKKDNFKILREVDEDYLNNFLFKAQVPMPMLRSRVVALREVGLFLSQFHRPEKKVWENTLRELSPAALAYAIPFALPSWKDPFLKRAQLTMFMVIGRARALGLDLFDQTAFSELTVASDYMLPRLDLALGLVEVLPGSPLLEMIEKKEAIQSGSELETEIRAATVIVGDLMLEEMNKKKVWGEVDVTALDAMKWLLATGFHFDQSFLKNVQEKLFVQPMLPFHHTETTDY